MLPPHWQRKTPALIGAPAPVPRADALEQRLDVLRVRAQAAVPVGVGAQRQGEELLHVQVHERVLLAGARLDDAVVAVELDGAVGAHVHAHVDLLLGEAAQLLARHGHRDARG